MANMQDDLREACGRELREAVGRRFPGLPLQEAIVRLSGRTMYAAGYLEGIMGLRAWPGVDPDARLKNALEKALGVKLVWISVSASEVHLREQSRITQETMPFA